MPIKSLVWNAHSLFPKLPELNQLIDKHEIKLIFISESWLHDRSNVHMPHFTCYRLDRSRGGVCIFIHKSIPHSFSRQLSQQMAETIFLKIHTNNGDITVGSVYCSPALTRANAKKFFNKILSVSGSSILAGDFNAKHTLWNNTSNSHKGIDLLNLCDDKNFIIHSPNDFTCTPPVGPPSTLDLVLSKGVPGISALNVVNDLSSDHLPIIFEIHSDFNSINIKTRNYSKTNWKKFRSLLTADAAILEKNFPTLSSAQVIDSCVKKIVESINKSIDNSVPKKLPFKFRYKYSQKLHLLTKNRNYYRNIFMRTGDPTFKSAKNQLDRLIKLETTSLRQESFNEKVASLNTKDLSLYRFAKNLKNKKSATPPLKMDNNKWAISNQAKADTLAKAFLKCHKTSASMVSPHELEVNNSINMLNSSNIRVPRSKLSSINEVKEAISELKPRKAPGCDNIPNLVLKVLPKEFIFLLTRVFNACFHIAYFPTEWKIGKIIAIPKPGKNRDTPTNYRPISLLSTIGKIFEKLVLQRLKSFESDNKIFIPNQCGFRNNHSTIQQVLRITEKATFGFNKNKSTGMVLLDIEKAFDSVWGNALVHKLLALKFPLYLVKLIKSFLNNRKAFVEHMGSSSSTFDIPAGVPQGSILAPFLFNVFINDIKKPKDCDIFIFADDTALTYQASWKNDKLIKKKLEEGLGKVTKFLNSWKIKVNNSKTEFIVFTKSTAMIKKLKNNPPTVNSHTLDWKNSVRYLGVHLDSKLLFKQHIDISIKKANGTISTLFPIFRKNSPASLKAKMTIYRSYIRPVMTYAGTIILNSAKTHLNRLQVMQNKCLRMALSAPYYTKTSDLHLRANIPTITQFIKNNADTFYDNTKDHENPLIKPLGTYTSGSIPFRVKHRLPRAF